jgi:hypothetical protein
MTLMAVVHVDDVILVGTKKAIEEFKKQLKERFNISDLGRFKRHLGVWYEWSVDKRYNDFYHLNESLKSKAFASLPLLPPKTFFPVRDAKQLQRRKEDLANYLRALTAREDILNSKEMVTWGVGHELVHYAFIMRENQWQNRRATFADNLKHHCDLEFKQITRAIADEIWNIYHSDTQRAAMYDEVEKSCFNEPNQ